MTISPLIFSLQILCSENILEYDNLREITQGGPIVGSIKINNSVYGGSEKFEFGGPALCYKSHLLIPYYKRFSFRLSAIDIVSGGIRFGDQSERLLLLKGVSNGRVEYYSDLDNKILKSCSLEDLLSKQSVFLKKKQSLWDIFFKEKS